MNRVQRQRGTETKYANTILSWIHCAIRPLTVHEIRYALAIVMAESSSLDKEWLPDASDLASICAGFVTIDRSETIRFSHFSVQEFFDREVGSGMVFQNASQKFALACLKCLTLDDFSTGPHPTSEEMQKRIDEVPFLCYAAQFWFRHDYKHMLKPDNEISKHLDVLFNPHNQSAYYNWLRVHQPYKGWIGECPWLAFKDIPPVTFYTAFLGLGDLTDKLLKEHKENHNVFNAMREEALLGAAAGGHKEITVRLLDEGVPLDVKNKEGADSLSQAAGAGHLEVVKILLKGGAQVDGKNIHGWTPLRGAARNGHLEVVQLLLSYGANAKANNEGDRALNDAVCFGHTEIVRLLLERGADMKIHEMGGTPLHWAAKNGLLEILKLLIFYKSDVEAKCRTGRSVVQWLLGDGTWFVVQGKRVLWGMGSEHREVAMYLLQHVSQNQAEGQNHDGQTLLHWSAGKGFEEVVRASLERGIDPNVKDHAKGREPMTARDIAIEENHLNIVSLL
jgi:ankyrin repeat protein